jgi:hypothetical protein
MPDLPLDHLIGGGQERLWDGNADRLGRLEIGEQLHFRWLLHWQIGWFIALENACGINAKPAAIASVDRG